MVEVLELTVNLHLELVVSLGHIVQFLRDILLQVLEFTFDRWLLDEILEVSHDNLNFLFEVGLKFITSGLELFELHSMFLGVKLAESFLESLADLLFILFLVIHKFLELHTELMGWSIEVADISRNISCLLLNSWVQGMIPHLLTFIVPMEVGFESFMESLQFFSNGLDLSHLLWIIEYGTGLAKSLANLLELSMDLSGKYLELRLNLWTRTDEFSDISSNSLLVSSDCLELLVFHVKVPHSETLIVPFESLLDFMAKSLHLSSDFVDASLVLWVIEQLSGLLKSELEFFHRFLAHLA